MNVYQFNISDKIRYGGGSILIAAPTLARARTHLGGREGDVDTEGSLFRKLKWHGDEGIILDEIWIE